MFLRFAIFSRPVITWRTSTVCIASVISSAHSPLRRIALRSPNFCIFTYCFLLTVSSNFIISALSWTDYVRNEEVLHRVKEQRNFLHEIRKRKANWIGHILRRNCLLQRVIEGKIKGGIEVTRKRGRRRRKLLDDLKERRWCCHLKEEPPDRTIWTARFGRGFGPVVRQTAKWMMSSSPKFNSVIELYFVCFVRYDTVM